MCVEIGQLAIAGFAGHAIPTDLKLLAREFDLGGVILFARNVAEPEQVAELCTRRAGAAPGAAAVGERRSGGRPRRAPEGAVHRVAADGDARAAAATTRWRSGSRARWRRSCARSASRSTTRRCSTSSPTRRIRPSATARSPRRPRTSRGSARAIIRALQAEGIAACGKHFPGHGDTSVDSHLELPLVEHPPDRLERGGVRAVPRGDRGGRGGDHDGARARPVARRGAAGDAVAAHRHGMLKERSATTAWSSATISR